MTDPGLPAAKFRPPPAPAWPAPRPRLQLALQAGRPVTLISAPPGFGKTTLAAAWLAAAPRPAAWLTLDESDDDPARFGAALAAALRRVKPGLGTAALAVLGAPQPAPVQAVVAALLADLETAGPVTLVLDDLHHLTLPAVHQALVFLVDHRPADLRLVALSRADPPWPLARWRARGQLAEVRAAELRFRPDEAAAFLRQAEGLQLTADDIARLTTRTEGWIAGLQLAALALRGQPAGPFIETFSGSHRFVADYLVEEALRAQPAHIQDFLMRTSILERLSPDLCAAILDDAADQPADATLEQVERANLFLTALDDERCWYRYHRLFSDVLQARLRSNLPGPDRASLHRRASRWLSQQADWAAAIQHVLAAATLDPAQAAVDWEQAAAWIEAAAPAAFQRGEIGALRAWLPALPEAVIIGRPALRLLRARLELVAGRLDAALADLQALEATPADPDWRREIAVTRALIASRLVDPLAAQFQEQALRELPPGETLARGSLHISLSHAAWLRGDLSAAEQHGVQALALCRAAGSPPALLAALLTLAVAREMQARLGEAEALAREALALGQTDGQPWPLASVASAHTALGRVLFERGELAPAEFHLRRGTQLAERLAAPIETWFGWMNLARWQRLRGDLPGAFEALDQAERAAQSASVPQAGPQTRALRALCWALAGRGAEAAAYIDQTYAELLRQDQPLDLDLMREYELLVIAETLAALGRSGPAAALAARLIPPAERGGRGHSLIRLHLILAAAEARGGPALEQAVRLAAPGGYRAPFWEQPPAVRRRLPADLAAGVSAPTADPAPEALTARELDVLRLLGEGRSNREIAQRLTVAPETVKVHLKHIYAKLDVRDRRAAAARARALRLV